MPDTSDHRLCAACQYRVRRNRTAQNRELWALGGAVVWGAAFGAGAGRIGGCQLAGVRLGRVARLRGRSPLMRMAMVSRTTASTGFGPVSIALPGYRGEALHGREDGCGDRAGVICGDVSVRAGLGAALHPRPAAGGHSGHAPMRQQG